MNRKYLFIIALGLFVYAVSLRLLPHPANFAPLTAMAIFAGAKLPKHFAVGLVLATVIISDALIGFYDLGPMLVVWTCYIAIALFSHKLLKRSTLIRTGLVILASSVFFFVATNLAVWATTDLYPKTIAGLEQCFILAIPFFRNSLAGDLFYAASLFGVFESAKALAPHIKRGINHYA